MNGCALQVSQHDLSPVHLRKALRTTSTILHSTATTENEGCSHGDLRQTTTKRLIKDRLDPTHPSYRYLLQNHSETQRENQTIGRWIRGMARLSQTQAAGGRIRSSLCITQTPRRSLGIWRRWIHIGRLPVRRWTQKQAGSAAPSCKTWRFDDALKMVSASEE